ncbi:MAG: CooT family nickel-binding protein [Chloroflexota bacterium]
MCLAKVFLNGEGGAPVMTEIARVKFDGAEIRLENLFGESKTFTGRLREIDFMASRLLLEGKETLPGQV